MQQEPKCTLTNEELILRVKDWTINLAKSGGKAWTLQIPANVNEDPDLLIGELIKRFKTLLKPGGESAGTWVKASEMNHEEFIAYYARLDHDTEAEIKSSGYFKDDFFFFHMHNLKINKDQFSVLEILDESQSLDNKDREEQAEWEFVQILKENYEAAKRSDEYHFAGKTKKEAVVETYEDLFEIIKGLPLKRQKVDFSFLNDNKDREIAFHKWVTENEYEINNRAQITHSIEQFHEIWEQSLNNKPRP